MGVGAKSKTYTLDDGRIVTRKQLCDMTGLSDKTIWLRLTRTRDYDKLSRPSQIPRAVGQKRSSYKETYKDLSPKLLKLLFGKW